MTPGKTCVGPCAQTLPVDQFGPNRQRKDGLSCYCRPCDRIMNKRVRINTERGITRTGLVDAQPAREHVEQLCLRGMTRHQIAELAGINRTQIRNLLIGQPSVGQGPAKRLRATTAAALLTVTFTPCEPVAVPEGRSRKFGATVEPTGTRRRLEALMANGWPAYELSRRLGHLNSGLQLPRAGRRYTSSTAAAVRALYDELSDTPGPSPRAATLYRGRGYLHPGWWDVDTIDDPDAEPAGLREQLRTLKGWPVEVERDRPLTEQIHVLTKTGLSDDEIAQRLGTTAKQIRRHRSAAA
jgi:DNA-binding CsgD family transcriptional regulator